MAAQVELETFLGEWRDTLGHTVRVDWAPSGNRHGQLDVSLSKSGKDPIRLNIKRLGAGRFTCGHYDLDLDGSDSRKIVWTDVRSKGKTSVWEREREYAGVRRSSRSRSRGAQRSRRGRRRRRASSSDAERHVARPPAVPMLAGPPGFWAPAPHMPPPALAMGPHGLPMVPYGPASPFEASSRPAQGAWVAVPADRAVSSSAAAPAKGQGGGCALDSYDAMLLGTATEDRPATVPEATVAPKAQAAEAERQPEATGSSAAGEAGQRPKKQPSPALEPLKVEILPQDSEGEDSDEDAEVVLPDPEPFEEKHVALEPRLAEEAGRATADLIPLVQISEDASGNLRSVTFHDPRPPTEVRTKDVQQSPAETVIVPVAPTAADAAAKQPAAPPWRQKHLAAAAPPPAKALSLPPAPLLRTTVQQQPPAAKAVPNAEEMARRVQAAYQALLGKAASPEEPDGDAEAPWKRQRKRQNLALQTAQTAVK